MLWQFEHLTPPANKSTLDTPAVGVDGGVIRLFLDSLIPTSERRESMYRFDGKSLRKFGLGTLIFVLQIGQSNIGRSVNIDECYNTDERDDISFKIVLATSMEKRLGIL